MENLLLWIIGIIAAVSLVFGFVLGRLIKVRAVALLVILIAPFLILVLVAGLLESMIVVQTWRTLAAGRMIDAETIGFFAVAYLIATFPAAIGGLIGRVLRGW